MKNHLVLLSVVYLLLFGAHFAVNMFFPNPLKIGDVVIMHVFLLGLFSAGVFLLNFINDFDKNKLGVTFLGLSVVKMLFALGYILIQLHVFKKPNSLAISFVLVYFLYLIYISVIAFQLLNKNDYIKKVE